MSPRLVVVGGGRMGEALLSGLVAGGWAAPSDLAVAETVGARRDQLAQRFPEVQVTGTPVAAEGAVIAVKPGDVETACRAVASVGVERVLSIAAGIRLARLEAWLGPGVPVVRAMPNTPALVGQGASAVSAGNAAGDSELRWAEEVLGAVGTVVRVPEHQLDAVTGLSGSGPAYVFLVTEALVEAGVSAGLTREVSSELVVQTLLGSARLLADTGQGPEALRAAVTSPGGTTAAGLAALVARAVRAAFMEAVRAATERSVELGGAGT
jgi:pyrroline-5-carboxylate reductase